MRAPLCRQFFVTKPQPGSTFSNYLFFRITKADRKEVHLTHCLARRVLMSDDVHSFPEQHLLQGANVWILYYLKCA